MSPLYHLTFRVFRRGFGTFLKNFFFLYGIFCFVLYTYQRRIVTSNKRVFSFVISTVGQNHDKLLANTANPMSKFSVKFLFFVFTDKSDKYDILIYFQSLFKRIIIRSLCGTDDRPQTIFCFILT